MAFYLATHAPIADDSRHCTQFTNARRKGSARSTQRAFIAIALSFAVLTAPLSQAAEPSLTLAEALRLAATDSRQLVAQDAAVTAASEMAVSAGERPDPVLKLGIDNLPVDGPGRLRIGADFMTMRRIGVMQEFTRSDKLDLRRQRGESEAERERVAKQSILANLQRDTALAWIDRYFADRQRALLDEQIGEARLAVDGAAIAYRTGRGSQADIVTARAAIVMLEDKQLQIERQQRVSTLQLARWIGSAAERPVLSPPDWATPALGGHDSVQEIDHTLSRHPTLTLLAAQESTAALDSKIAQAAKHPDWTWELNFALRGSGFSNMISLGVSIPLQIAPSLRQDREIAAKNALIDQIRAQREDVLRVHTSELRVMQAEWENFGQRIKRVDEGLIPLATERTTAANIAYRSGTGMLTAVLDARKNEIDVRMQRLDLERERARVWAQLKYLIPSDEAISSKDYSK